MDTKNSMELKRFFAGILTVLLAQPALATNIEYPPCNSYITPFNYVGCYGDPSEDALIFRSTVPSDGMTIEKCQAICKGNEFRYSGLKYYGICYCGNLINGESAPESECNHECNGNKTQTCGGDHELSVYRDPTFYKADLNVTDYRPLGCFTDLLGGVRSLGWQLNLPQQKMTPELCMNSCSRSGFPYVGLENGNECWCGTKIHPNAASVAFGQCNTPCSGDLTLACGAANRLQIWQASNFKSSKPCGSEEPPASSTTSKSTTSTATSTNSSQTSSTSSSTTMITSTTTPRTTTTTTAPDVCTTVIPGDNYCCGDWCSSPLPDWDDLNSCTKARAQCRLEAAACFKHAGSGRARDCFDYVRWCARVERYCTNTCQHKKGSCSKHHCMRKNPPKGGRPPVTRTVPCSTATPTGKPTSTAVTTTTTTIPEPTNACVQPEDDDWGYAPGNPIGGVELPFVACNNDAADHGRGNHFKCYTERKWSACPSFERKDLHKACAVACMEQYDQCIDVYAEGPDDDFDYDDGRRGGRDGKDRQKDEDEGRKLRKRRCKVQFADCLGENRRADPGQMCARFGSA